MLTLVMIKITWVKKVVGMCVSKVSLKVGKNRQLSLSLNFLLFVFRKGKLHSIV